MTAPDPDNPTGGSSSGSARSEDRSAAPSEIRHAATVVVARPTPGGEAEIYMLRRSARSTFMPSTLVFPGGRLDPEDGSPDDDQAWERCARRECLEEAALQLAGPLRWFDTWLTPSAESRRRYWARFYLASLPGGTGDEARADGTETHAGRWATPDKHLADWERGQIDLPPPTLSTLLRLQALSFDRVQTLAELDPGGVILPKVTLEGGRPTIVMPHDPKYLELPGEAQPAPDRVLTLPRRFVRDERGWRPWQEPND